MVNQGRLFESARQPNRLGNGRAIAPDDLRLRRPQSIEQIVGGGYSRRTLASQLLVTRRTSLTKGKRITPRRSRRTTLIEWIGPADSAIFKA
jgi:hypothetical protein